VYGNERQILAREKAIANDLETATRIISHSGKPKEAKIALDRKRSIIIKPLTYTALFLGGAQYSLSGERTSSVQQWTVPSAVERVGGFSLVPQAYWPTVDYIKSAKNQISAYLVHDYYTFLGNATNPIFYDRFVPGITSGLTRTNIINANTVNTLTGSYSGNIITETKAIFPNPLLHVKNVLRSANNLTYSTLFKASPDY
jgi:hypothetical protein